MTQIECNCICHTQPGTTHIVACCQTCPTCHKHIQHKYWKEHQVFCNLSMKSSWDNYAAHCLKNIPTTSIQYIETQRAFYAGAWSLSSKVDVVADNLPIEVGSRLYDFLHSEINQFVAEQ